MVFERDVCKPLKIAVQREEGVGGARRRFMRVDTRLRHGARRRGLLRTPCVTTRELSPLRPHVEVCVVRNMGALSPPIRVQVAGQCLSPRKAEPALYLSYAQAYLGRAGESACCP